MPALSIDPPLFTEFPTLRVGAFVATGFNRVPVMSLCAAISACHRVRVSGHDLDVLPESLVRLRHARPDSDWFLPMGARPTDLPLKSDVVVYAAGELVLAWMRACHESRHTCLYPRTKRAIFFIEAIGHEHADVAEAALSDLRHELTTFGARTGAIAIADVTCPDISLPFTADEESS